MAGVANELSRQPNSCRCRPSMRAATGRPFPGSGPSATVRRSPRSAGWAHCHHG